MKRNTILSIFAGLALIGAVLFKNVYSLQNRIETDKNPLKNYSTNDIELLLPKNWVEQTDTSYLADGKILSIAKGLCGSVEANQQVTQYGLSVAEYSKAVTDSSSFHPDSLKNNLYHTLSNTEDFQLTSLTPVMFNNRSALKYAGKRGNQYENAIVLNVENKVFSIYMLGPSSDSKTYEDILASVKIKQGQ